MGIGQFRGDKAMVEDAYRSALRLAPASFQIRAARQHSLKPRWGGSYEEMRAVAAEAQQHLGKNPRLATLSGYILLDQSEVAARARDYDTALKLLSQAISTGEDAPFLSMRGRVNYRADRYEEALRDFDRAVVLRPRGWWYTDVRLADTLFYKAQYFHHFRKFDEALIWAERAAQIDPFVGETFPITDWIAYLRTQVDAKKP